MYCYYSTTGTTKAGAGWYTLYYILQLLQRGLIVIFRKYRVGINIDVIVLYTEYSILHILYVNLYNRNEQKKMMHTVNETLIKIYVLKLNQIKINYLHSLKTQEKK